MNVAKLERRWKLSGSVQNINLTAAKSLISMLYGCFVKLANGLQVIVSVWKLLRHLIHETCLYCVAMTHDDHITNNQ